MGFKDAKRQVIEALRAGAYNHEPRADPSRNMLLTGVVTPEQAVDIIERCRGNHADNSPHHLDSAVEVWVFHPDDWYVKFYFREGVWFISFHK